MSRLRPRLLVSVVTFALALGVIPAANAGPSDAAGARKPGAGLEAAEISGSTSLPRGGDKATVLRLGKSPDSERYIVQLADPAVATYSGGVERLRATKPAAGGRLDPAAAPVRRYAAHLEDEQDALRGLIAREIGRSPRVDFTYIYALNGLAVRLTADEAAAVAGLPEVTSVVVDVRRELQTDNGPAWIDAPALWDGTATGVDGTRGGGIVAGILDTGINPSNPSFADTVPMADGGDGFDHTNPLGGGTYLGMCDPANADQYDERFACNDKLIGAWDFSGDGPFDTDGHGSHTASTVAGNQVDAVVNGPSGISETRRISGVAPHANLIAYDVCDVDGCSMAATTAALDQAIADGVDVLNYSIGGWEPSAAWSDPEALGFLAARAAGIFVATAAGNDGPWSETIGTPADIPWITTAAASTHDRSYVNALTDLTRADGTGLPDLEGLGFTTGYGPAPIVDAADYGNPWCEPGSFRNRTFNGEIVICERGFVDRLEMGEVVSNAGAGGMILANDEESGDSLTGDAHELPAVHITYDDAVALREWLAEGTGHTGTIAGATLSEDPAKGDVTADFSSRGPNRAMDLISPSVTAPGVDILAAFGASTPEAEAAPQWGFSSGTSMASPHVAGAGALLKVLEPEWSPAEIQSALMTTATTAVTKEDGSTPADPFDMGSGRIDLDAAANAGLVLDETLADYQAADPSLGGDPAALNLASMATSQCLHDCAWTRTVTGVADGTVEWTASVESAPDITLSVEPATFTLAEGETQEIIVTADVRGASTGTWQFGRVTLTPSDGDVSTAGLPVAVMPSTGVLPAEVLIDTRRDAGSQLVEGVRAIEITDLTVDVAGLTPAETQEIALPQDPTDFDPFDGPEGTEVVLVEVPEGTSRLVVEVTDATAQDIDLFVGLGDTPGEETLQCVSASFGSDERCDLAAPEAGTWWVVVQNWQSSDEDATDTLTLGTAVVGSDAGNMWVEGPQAQPVGEPFDLRVFYDEPALEAGQRWYGALSLGSSPQSPGDIGIIPVDLNRFADDVTKTADVETAAPGDTVTYELTVQPNVTAEDLAYTITDAIPEGMTYVEGSATDGATVTDGVLTWEGISPTPAGVEGEYVITRSDADPLCVNPLSEDGSYVDLEELGFLAHPEIAGDTVAFNVGAGAPFSFYGVDYDGMWLTDDGFVVFDAATHYDGEPWVPQTLPDPQAPNNLLAMLWQDMEIVYDEATNRGVTVVEGETEAGGLIVVEYDDIQLVEDPESTYDVQLVAFRGQDDTEGSYEFYVAYDNVTGPVDGPLTVGTENADGSSGQTLVNHDSGEGVVADGNVVCFDYAGASFAPVTVRYEVTVDDDGSLSDGDVLTNEATHVTDNPGAQPVTVGVDVTIDGVEQPTEEPTAGPTAEPTPAPSGPPGRPGGGHLPSTGVELGLLAVVVLLLLGAGAGAVRMRRATD